MNDFFLNLGLSWTLSKALPYGLMLILGAVLFFAFRRKLKRSWLKWLNSLVLLIPFAAYFAMNPIYEGDFSNESREMKAEMSFGLKKNELTLLAIPGCPFCAESIQDLNKIATRTGVDRINFVVFTSDQEMLKPYAKLAESQIEMSVEEDFSLYATITQGRFPTFVYSDGSSLRIWSNNGFGVRAKDWLENELSNE